MNYEMMKRAATAATRRLSSFILSSKEDLSNMTLNPKSADDRSHPADSRPREIPSHFHSLDALRGMAALVVVFWHWQHFFFQGTKLGTFDAARQPFYSLFEPLYTDGWRAVDLFFCLSGFIFFWLYGRKISNRQTSAWEFVVHRFSRLYPLHCLTLLIVAVAQQFMLRACGSYFVFANNDLYHFFLQTVLASNWGFEQGASFNGPIWSVSVEVLCYLVFYLACLFRFNRWWMLCVLAGCGYWMQKMGLDLVGRGILSFFIGGIAFYLFDYIARHRISWGALWGLVIFVGLLWIVIPLNAHQNLLYQFYRAHLWKEGVGFHGKDIFGALALQLSQSSFEFVLFPATIITCALWEMNGGVLWRRLAFTGNISYSSYLLYFPLQLLFVVVATSLSIPREFFYSPLAFLLFFIILIPGSFYCYRYFERPCQSHIRRWAFGNRDLSPALRQSGRDAASSVEQA